MVTRGGHIVKKTVVETAISTRTIWSFSWHYKGMKEDALQKGLPAPN
jgi:hypothetical protein